MNGIAKEGLRLEGSKTWLEPFTQQHLNSPEYIGWLRDPEIVRTLNLPGYLAAPVPYGEVEEYCERMMTSATELFLAMHHVPDGSFVGTVKAGYINLYSGTADIGIMIGRQDLWGQGLASDALENLCAYLLDVAGLRRLTAGVMAINPAMIRVFEKLGFLREGVFRQQDRVGDDFVDHVHLGCLKQEFASRDC